MAQSPKRLKLESTIAYLAVVIVALSILSILATLILTAAGATEIPVILAQLPLVGLPIGFVLIMSMLVVSIIRRSKENRS